MDAGAADKKSIGKNLPPRRLSFLWVISLANGLTLILLTFLPSLSLHLSADTATPPRGPLSPSVHDYELQDIHLERIHFASNPPSHPLTFKVDHRQKLWVVDQLKPAINPVKLHPKNVFKSLSTRIWMERKVMKPHVFSLNGQKSTPTF